MLAKFGTRVAGKQTIWRFFNAILTFAEFFDKPPSFLWEQRLTLYAYMHIYPF